jgi:hypothetical protein
MRIRLGRTSGALCLAALVLAPAGVSPAAARGGGPTNVGGFTNPGDYGAHFSGGEDSAPGGAAGHYGAQRHGGQFGGYPGYHGGYNCDPATLAQNPQMCR